MARALAVREPPINTTSKAGQHHAPIRAGILIAIERIETISEFLSLFAIAGFFYLLPLKTMILPLGQASGLVGTARTLGTLSSMVIISLTMNAYLGDEALGPNNIPEFLEAMHINFALFGILNLLGIFCSLGRMGGRVRRLSHRLLHPWNHH